MKPLAIKLDPYVIQTLMRDLTGHDRRPATFLAYLWLTAEAQTRSGPVAISYADLADETGLSRSAVQAAVAWLLDRGLLSVQRASITATPVYRVLKPWIRRSRSA